MVESHSDPKRASDKPPNRCWRKMVIHSRSPSFFSRRVFRIPLNIISMRT